MANERDHAATYGYENNLLRHRGDETDSLGEVYVDNKLVDRVRPAARLHLTSDEFFRNQAKHFAEEYGVPVARVEILLTANIHPHSVLASCLDCPTDRS